MFSLDELVRWHVLWKNWGILSKRLGIRSTVDFIEKLDWEKASSLLRSIEIGEGDYKEVEKSLEEGVKFLHVASLEYPPELKKLKNGKIYPPLLLYAKGKHIDFNRCVAIVGTRNCSLYGRLRARSIAKNLVRSGITVVTGLARGIDTEATCGALEAEGKIVAVLPWLEPVYPPENEKLSLDVTNSGLLMSENLKKSRYQEKQQFFLRNRVISGLSKAVILIEARSEGGTTYQIDYALKRGKRVFILEPKKNDRLGIEGFKNFLRYNAVPFSEISEIMDEIQRLVSSS